MFGLEGTAVTAGFALTILSALLCIVYGFVNWNRGQLTDEEAAQKDLWAKEEVKVEEGLLGGEDK